MVVLRETLLVSSLPCPQNKDMRNQHNLSKWLGLGNCGHSTYYSDTMSTLQLSIQQMCAFFCTKSNLSLSLSPSPSRRFSIGPTISNRRSINFDTNSTNCQLATTLQYDDHCMTHLHLLASFHALASEGLMQRDHRDSIFSDNSTLEYCPSFNKSQTLVIGCLGSF